MTNTGHRWFHSVLLPRRSHSSLRRMWEFWQVFLIHSISSVQSLSCIWLFVTPWLQHARPSCPSPTSGVYSNSCPLSQWCHPTISSSVVSFFSRLQSFPASGSFQMRQFFTSGGESIGISTSASVLPMNIQHWFPYNGMFFEEIVAWPLPEKCTNSQTLLLKHWHFNNLNGESRDPDLHDCLFSRIWSKFLSENPCFFSEQIVLLEDQFLAAVRACRLSALWK